MPNCLVNIYQAHHTRGWSNPCPHPFPRAFPFPFPFPFPFTHLLSKSYRNCICGCNLNCNCRTRPASTHPTLGNPLPATVELLHSPPLPSSRHLPFALLAQKFFQLNLLFSLAWHFDLYPEQIQEPNPTELDRTELN